MLLWTADHQVDAGVPESAPRAALAAGAVLGIALTAGWHLLALVGIARDPRARQVAGWRW